MWPLCRCSNFVEQTVGDCKWKEKRKYTYTPAKLSPSAYDAQATNDLVQNLQLTAVLLYQRRRAPQTAVADLDSTYLQLEVTPLKVAGNRNIILILAFVHNISSYKCIVHEYARSKRKTYIFAKTCWYHCQIFHLPGAYIRIWRRARSAVVTRVREQGPRLVG